VFGKPNVMVNDQGLALGQFVNKTLTKFTVQELVNMAETYSSGSKGQSVIMKKIFEQIDRERNENEYNRTTIQDRVAGLGETLQRFQYDLNQSGDVRLLDVTDSSAKQNSYLNKSIENNRNSLYRAMGGLKDFNDLVYLQIKGKNQLYKEIDECH
jgi:hypothetical protein